MTHLFTILFLMLACVAQGAGLGPYNPAQHSVNGFMPTQVPGLQFWLDASRITATNGASISSAPEFGPNKLIVTNSGGSKTPVMAAINGRQAVQFDGTDDYFATSQSISFQSRQMSVFHVVESTKRSFQMVCEHGTNAGTVYPAFRVDIYDDFTSPTEYMLAQLTVRNTNGYNIAMVKTNSALQDRFVFGSTFDASLIGTNEGKAYINNQNLTYYRSDFKSETDDNLSTSRTLYIGSRNSGQYFLSGKLAELIMFTNKVSDSQLSQINRYLGTKYGIVVK